MDPLLSTLSLHIPAPSSTLYTLTAFSETRGRTLNSACDEVDNAYRLEQLAGSNGLPFFMASRAQPTGSRSLVEGLVGGGTLLVASLWMVTWQSTVVRRLLGRELAH